jgi:hypothetical protein
LYLHNLITIQYYEPGICESDEQWLHEVAPTLSALIVHLTRENNGIRVYEQKQFIDPKTNREAHAMSNGLSYAKDENNVGMLYKA